MKKNHRIIAAAALLAALGAGGSAFTATLDVSDEDQEFVGAGNVSTSGGTLLSIQYDTTYDAVAHVDEVTTVNLVFDGEYIPAESEVTLHIDDEPLTCGALAAGAGQTTVACTHAGIPVGGITTTHVAMLGEQVDV